MTAAATALPRAILSTDADIKRFLLGGNATITVLNTETGERRTIKVSCKRDKVDDGWAIKSPFFVNVMTGSCNEEHFTYTGLVPSNAAKTGDKFYAYSPKRGGARSEKAGQGSTAFKWLWSLIHGRNSNGSARTPSDNHVAAYSNLEIWHEGRCGCCGRKLTVPESIDRGIGPVCWDRLGAMGAR